MPEGNSHVQEKSVVKCHIGRKGEKTKKGS